MFRSGGTATTATIGIVAGVGTTPTPQWASAQVVSPSAHDSTAAWKPPRSNGTTAAGSRAGSAAATNRERHLKLIYYPNPGLFPASPVAWSNGQRTPALPIFLNTFPA